MVGAIRDYADREAELLPSFMERLHRALAAMPEGTRTEVSTLLETLYLVNDQSWVAAFYELPEEQACVRQLLDQMALQRETRVPE
jgi:hypothetical protein